jgi:hypothetical protein
MNAPLRCAVYALSLAAGLGTLHASGPMAVYALIDKVNFEPNADHPDRIRISGVFITSEKQGSVWSDPQRGYLYFSLPKRDPERGREEWYSLQKVAGTRQVVAFGKGWDAVDVKVRKTDSPESSPDEYTLNIGLTTLSAAQPRAKLLLEYKDQ